MSFSYRIEPELLLVVGEGVITQAERMNTMRSWIADPAFRPSLNTLCDFSRAQSTPTLGELHAVVDFINRNASAVGPARIAIVTGKPVTFGVARQFAALAESSSVDVQVFASQDAAGSWLRRQLPD